MKTTPVHSLSCLAAAGLWLGFLAVAVAGSLIREKVLIPGLGPLAGRAVGTLLVSLIIFALIYVYIGKLTGVTRAALLLLGQGWTLATIAFEFLFGHYVMRQSWQSLWADYNVFQGRLWPLVLIVTLLGPLVAPRLGKPGHVR
jgi:hypothetical protein